MPRRKTTSPRGVLRTPVSDGQSFEHLRYYPSADLAAYLEHFWTVKWDLRDRPPYRAETLPHPTVYLSFQPGVGGRVGGVARGKFSTLLTGQGSVFSAKFRPGGFYPFVRRPVSEFAGLRVGVGTVWGGEGAGLEEAVLATEDHAQKIEIIEAFLRGLQPVPDPRATLATTIADAIAADRGLLTTDDVARRFSLNPRRLQRLFARYIGIGPKYVIQRYRLLEAAEQLARGGARQAALALSLGYADQAHLARDFKAVVGTPPAAYARRAREAPGT